MSAAETRRRCCSELLVARERQEKRQAARERESEVDQKVRELERLQRQVQEQCRLVTLYETAGKAARLAEVRHALQRARQQQEEQEAKVKVSSSWYETCSKHRGLQMIYLESKGGCLVATMCVRSV